MDNGSISFKERTTFTPWEFFRKEDFFGSGVNVGVTKSGRDCCWLEMRVPVGNNQPMFQFVRVERGKQCALLPRLAVLAWLVLAPCGLLQAASSFKFAWLSDTHVGATTGEQDLRAAVSDINSLT